MKNFVKASVRMMAVAGLMFTASVSAEPIAVGPEVLSHSTSVGMGETNGAPFDTVMTKIMSPGLTFEFTPSGMDNVTSPPPGMSGSGNGASGTSITVSSTLAGISLSGQFSDVWWTYNFNGNPPLPSDMLLLVGAYKGNALVDAWYLVKGTAGETLAANIANVTSGWYQTSPFPYPQSGADFGGSYWYYALADSGFAGRELGGPNILSSVPLPSVAFLSPVLLAGFAALGRFRKQRA